MNKDAIKELKYSIEPNQGFMECRTGTVSEETIKLAIEALEKQTPQKPKKVERATTSLEILEMPKLWLYMGI